MHPTQNILKKRLLIFKLVEGRTDRLFLKIAATIFFLIKIVMPVNAQNVSEIITDFGGFWKSSNAIINPVKPNNSHNLLAFNHNGIRYSTGVNDALLTARGETFIAMDMRALPVRTIASTVTSNTKIGLGYMYDGNPNGPSALPPVNQLSRYLTDGIKGLDIGTGVANLPQGTVSFEITDLKLEYIGDGIPDILVTQFADPSGSTDRYEFLDANGNRVGNLVNVAFGNIIPVGNWTADFYEASTNPMVLTPGFTTTDRPLRLWAADFSDFGITASNISSIRSFQINLSGNSDVAFVGYNFNTLLIVLPVQLSSFDAALKKDHVLLTWSSARETNHDHFVVEKSTDARNFSPIAHKKGKGESVQTQTYTFHDQHIQSGKSYYRLKMVDKNGKFSYSDIVELNNQKPFVLKMYPNPAIGQITIHHGLSAGSIEIRNSAGSRVLAQTIQTGSKSDLNIHSLLPGLYQVSVSGTNYFQSGMLIVR